MTQPETYYAIERQRAPGAPWVELIRFPTSEEARMNLPDSERIPEGILDRVVRVTREVLA